MPRVSYTGDTDIIAARAVRGHGVAGWHHRPWRGRVPRSRWPETGCAGDWVVGVAEVYARCQRAGEKCETLYQFLTTRPDGEPHSSLPLS